MLMNQTIKSVNGVEYSIHKTVCGGCRVLYTFISQTMLRVIEYWLSSTSCLAQACNKNECCSLDMQ